VVVESEEMLGKVIGRRDGRRGGGLEDMFMLGCKGQAVLEPGRKEERVEDAGEARVARIGLMMSLKVGQGGGLSSTSRPFDR
jgi:hypothetical protein